MKRRQFLKLSLPISLPLVMAGRGDAQSVQADEQPSLTFGVIADPQYADYPAKGTRYYRNSIRKLQVAIKELNQQPLDFVVTLGDVIDRDFASFKAIMPLYDALKSPHRLVLGNHDFSVADEDKHRVMAAMGMKKNYYSEVRGDWRMIYLDGTEVSTFRYPKDDTRTAAAEQLLQKLKKSAVPQAAPWNEAIGKKQMAWLKQELDAAKVMRQRVIVFNHYPACPQGDAHNLWNADEVVELIAGYPHVAAYMNGHNHVGNYAEHKGCHYVNFKGMVETENTSAYAIVKCFDDRIEIDGIGAEPDRELKFDQ